MGRQLLNLLHAALHPQAGFPAKRRPGAARRVAQARIVRVAQPFCTIVNMGCPILLAIFWREGGLAYHPAERFYKIATARAPLDVKAEMASLRRLYGTVARNGKSPRLVEPG